MVSLTFALDAAVLATDAEDTAFVAAASAAAAELEIAALAAL